MSQPWWGYVMFWGQVFVGAYLGTLAIDYLMNSDQERFITPNKNKIYLASRTATLGHAIGTLYLTTKCFLDGPSWNIVNTDEQTYFLGYSLGYFVYDLIYQLFLVP